jgi:hypothetical protein
VSKQKECDLDEEIKSVGSVETKAAQEGIADQRNVGDQRRWEQGDVWPARRFYGVGQLRLSDPGPRRETTTGRDF